MHSIGGIACPLRPQAFIELMDTQDPNYNFIINGVTNGFNLIDETPDTSYACPNYKSATDSKQKLDELFISELTQGKISVVKDKPFCIHAIGAVPRKDRDDPRPITDCSRPYNYSVNDHMFPEKSTYNTVDTAAKLITPNCWFAVVDIHHAYRSVPISPENRKFMGFQWQFGKNGVNRYFVDNFLCFGSRSAPSIFNKISNSIAAIFRKLVRYKDTHIVNMLDDFLIIAPNKAICMYAQRLLITIIRKLGFGISWSKITGPLQKIIFLGIELNSIAMQLSLPQEKLEKLSNLLKEFNNKKRATKRELQSLCGHLNFASMVVKGGRTFCRRIINVMNKLKRQNHSTRLNSEFRKDINEFWLPFMHHFNGKAKILCNDPMPIGILQCDSSLKGYGIYHKGDFIAGSWDGAKSPPQLLNTPHWYNVTPPAAERHNINYLELRCILEAAKHFGPRWANQSVIVYTDNTQAMFNINKGSSQNLNTMELLRHLLWLSTKYNFSIKCKHISSEGNWIADALSRLHVPNMWHSLLDKLTHYGIPLFYRSTV